MYPPVQLLAGLYAAAGLDTFDRMWVDGHGTWLQYTAVVELDHRGTDNSLIL